MRQQPLLSLVLSLSGTEQSSLSLVFLPLLAGRLNFLRFDPSSRSTLVITCRANSDTLEFYLDVFLALPLTASAATQFPFFFFNRQVLTV